MSFESNRFPVTKSSIATVLTTEQTAVAVASWPGIKVRFHRTTADPNLYILRVFPPLSDQLHLRLKLTIENFRLDE